VLVVDSELFAENADAIRDLPGPIAVIVSGGSFEDADDDLAFDFISAEPTEAELLIALRAGVRLISSEEKRLVSEAAAEQKTREVAELHDIGIALSAEQDHGRLLEVILGKAREITNADAGSLFRVSSIDQPLSLPDGSMGRAKGKWLQFRLAQNDSLNLRFDEDILPLSRTSIAGYAAETGETQNLEDAYHPPKDKPFEFNRSFDEATGYRTKSMLVVPMQNREGDSIGVLQLINKKRSRDIVLDTPESFEQNVLPFDDHDVRLVRSLASQAAISVENNSLYLQRENLFRRFVDAAVKAIESRDPTTQGHSRRVADMTTELAKVTNRVVRGPYAGFRLSVEQVRELKYASLLHDFGKVGVKERVLVKATKLYHGELSLVRQRFKTIRRTLEAEHLRKMLDRLLEGDATLEQIEQMKARLAKELETVDEARQVVETANKPTVLDHHDFERLESLSGLAYTDVDGLEQPYLETDELLALSIPRGTLTPQERKLIESHVNHTYDFLLTIPWTRDLQEIPELAWSHHEKLDGSGYPNERPAPKIPPQTRMMTISDIYDALTARDRPYKPAIPTEKALEILEFDATKGKIDRDLLDLFIEAKVFEHGITN
jgi:HD-GYP domain-containing protein (c-di-GMP phosphodiesterase class II)